MPQNITGHVKISSLRSEQLLSSSDDAAFQGKDEMYDVWQLINKTPHL